MPPGPSMVVVVMASRSKLSGMSDLVLSGSGDGGRGFFLSDQKNLEKMSFFLSRQKRATKILKNNTPILSA